LKGAEGTTNNVKLPGKEELIALVEGLALCHEGTHRIEASALPKRFLGLAEIQELGKEGFPGLRELLKLGEIAVF